MEKPEKLKSIIIDSTKYRTTYSEKFTHRTKYVRPDESKITAFIPGTIFKIYVKQGQIVPKDFLLVELKRNVDSKKN